MRRRASKITLSTAIRRALFHAITASVFLFGYAIWFSWRVIEFGAWHRLGIVAFTMVLWIFVTACPGWYVFAYLKLRRLRRDGMPDDTISN